jgi:hypothetical protein
VEWSQFVRGSARGRPWGVRHGSRSAVCQGAGDTSGANQIGAVGDADAGRRCGLLAVPGRSSARRVRPWLPQFGPAAPRRARFGSLGVSPTVFILLGGGPQPGHGATQPSVQVQHGGVQVLARSARPQVQGVAAGATAAAVPRVLAQVGSERAARRGPRTVDRLVLPGRGLSFRRLRDRHCPSVGAVGQAEERKRREHPARGARPGRHCTPLQGDEGRPWPPACAVPAQAAGPVPHIAGPVARRRKALAPSPIGFLRAPCVGLAGRSRSAHEVLRWPSRLPRLTEQSLPISETHFGKKRREGEP